jgi:hypothetical protein
MDTIFQTITPYLSTILKAGLLAFVFALLVSLPYLIPQLVSVLKNLADKIQSEKIRQRVKDAIEKLGIVIGRLVEAESTIYRKEIIEILKDGKIENAEIVALAEKISKQALEILKPELATLNKYFVGEMLFDFTVKTVQSYLITVVRDRLGAEKVGPFPNGVNQ